MVLNSDGKRKFIFFSLLINYAATWFVAESLVGVTELRLSSAVADSAAAAKLCACI